MLEVSAWPDSKGVANKGPEIIDRQCKRSKNTKAWLRRITERYLKILRLWAEKLGRT